MSRIKTVRIFILSFFIILLGYGGAIHAETPCDLEELFRAKEPVWDATNIATLIPPDAATLAWFSSGIMKSYVLMYEATDNPYYLDRFIQMTDRLFSVRADRLGVVDAIRKYSIPSWTSGRYSHGKSTAEPVLTGMISYPASRFVWVVKQHPELPDYYQMKADEYLPLLEQTVDCHDDQWKNGPFDDEGEYGEIGMWPTSVNRTHSMGRTILMLWLVDRRSKDLDKVRRMAIYFKRRITHLPDGSVNWGHFMPDPLGRPPWDEDVSHAGATVDFVALCAQNDMVFTRRDIREFVKTFEKIYLTDGQFTSTVSGRIWEKRWSYGTVMRWGRLLQFDSTLLERLEDQACQEFVKPSRKPGTGVSVPYLLIAERMNRWLVE